MGAEKGVHLSDESGNCDTLAIAKALAAQLQAMPYDIILMGKCQEVWVLGDVISRGMSIEIEKAKKRRQPVRYFNKDFEEVESL